MLENWIYKDKLFPENHITLKGRVKLIGVIHPSPLNPSRNTKKYLDDFKVIESSLGNE